MNLIRIGLATLPIQRVAPNMRMKLLCRSGHFWWNSFFVLVAAPARSLTAIR
jgi:hypothetical protein